MAGDTGMAGKVALLLWAQTLGLTGAQTTHLLVDPPWVPPVKWDQVKLTCQGLGATTWYKDGQIWRQEEEDHVTVTESGTYTCDRSGSGLSPPVTVSDDWLVLQVPAQALLEGDTVTLRCRGWWNNTVTSVSFNCEGKELGRLHDGTELTLSPLQLQYSGRYHCKCRVKYWMSEKFWESALVAVTVHDLFSVPVLEGPPEPTEGSPLILRCISTPSLLRPRTPLLYVFYRDGQVLGGPQGSPQLLVPGLGVSHSGNYSCQVRFKGGAVWKSSAQLRITVHMPVANATITPSPLSHQVRAGDNVTLRCSVQVGSAPVTFTWLHNGKEVARGSLLELRDIDVGHSGTYQCVATNQLGQDGHRVFRTLSPELALEVTPRSPWITVAAGIGGTLLFLLLLVAVILAWHLWHRVAARNHQERPPPDPPEEGEVLYTHVVVTKRAGASPCATTLQDPQVTYAELWGHQGRPREPSDIYRNVL
ncbi:Fc receptor-like protein 3 isoform X3 [Haemorhous mexicanus]|uniref:Fc receptor-like protein 3 isoform X2 n=1 Tax=Haemorhous mexicanus TaxID=30427 RepID=UPI0028BF5264|nr:Fc receptor-like protein 3 isoform X2 [Haemorhous mexicanus]XP_059727245.1 Fc receptor-like protein 3 isoform X3 [Haemorhous mexicanus]